LDGSFMDHAAYEALNAWSTRHRSQGGRVVLGDGDGRAVSEPVSAHACRPWTPWRNHHCTRPTTVPATSGGQLLGGVGNFQRHTAPLVRDELARLAREGQRPGQLFLTCADSRLVTSMITSSGPGDLFTVRNVGNMVPPPGSDASCDSVAAAVEYAVDVLQVSSITVCGHSGCGAMQALLGSDHEPGAQTPLARWLRHGRPGLSRLIASTPAGPAGPADTRTAPGSDAAPGRSALPRFEGRPAADDQELLALINVTTQLEHLTAHPCVARRVADGTLHLHGMYFHVAEAQAYVLDPPTGVFVPVRPGTGVPGAPGGEAATSAAPRATKV
jgi:carbonic anhydrase